MRWSEGHEDGWHLRRGRLPVHNGILDCACGERAALRMGQSITKEQIVPRLLPATSATGSLASIRRRRIVRANHVRGGIMQVLSRSKAGDAVLPSSTRTGLYHTDGDRASTARCPRTTHLERIKAGISAPALINQPPRTGLRRAGQAAVENQSTSKLRCCPAKKHWPQAAAMAKGRHPSGQWTDHDYYGRRSLTPSM
jgi:hypothetical protein